MEHYLDKYVKDGKFDLPRLINDDFLLGSKLLWKNGLYISSTKLLLIAIDSIGFLEYGDTVKNPFSEWLNRFADLKSLGITSEELWEHRNSLLHMTNLDSRKVAAGTVKRLIAYVGVLPKGSPVESEVAKYFSLHSLIQVFAKACEQWILALNANPKKYKGVLERYDLVVADTRLMRMELDGG